MYQEENQPIFYGNNYYSNDDNSSIGYIGALQLYAQEGAHPRFTVSKIQASFHNGSADELHIEQKVYLSIDDRFTGEPCVVEKVLCCSSKYNSSVYYDEKLVLAEIEAVLKKTGWLLEAREFLAHMKQRNDVQLDFHIGSYQGVTVTIKSPDYFYKNEPIYLQYDKPPGDTFSISSYINNYSLQIPSSPYKITYT